MTQERRLLGPHDPTWNSVTTAHCGPALPAQSFPFLTLGPQSWDEQVQAAKDCYKAGASMLHVHVRDPQTRHGFKDFEQLNYMLSRLRDAVPKMILSVGGSISFAPKSPEDKAKWLDCDTRYMLTELDAKPDQVTIAIWTTMVDVVQMWSEHDIEGIILEKNAKLREAFVGLWADSGPAFYIEHLKRLRQHAIQPYFMLAHVHQLEIVELLIRAGLYMGPLNHNDPTGFPAVGDVYVQAFCGSVTLPAAGYNYSSGWTPLLAGLSPAGTPASLAARTLWVANGRFPRCYISSNFRDFILTLAHHLPGTSSSLQPPWFCAAV